MYPEAKLPDHPILSWAGLRGRRGHVPGVPDAAQRIDTLSARLALAHALELLDVGPDASVLVPAYHCTAIVEPIVWRKARPVFYRVHGDASVDLDDVAAKVDPSTKALLVIHYFGFPQDLDRLRRFCDDRGIALVEDCAHALFGEWNGRPLGTVGDCAIASWWKFFGVREGGCLASGRLDLGRVRLVHPGAAFQARAFFNAVEDADRFGRLRPLSTLLLLPIRMRAWLKARRPSASGATPTHVPRGAPAFDPHWLRFRISRFSRFVTRRAALPRLAERRRAHYRRLAEGLRDLPRVSLPFPALPATVVPYVFPAVFEEPERVFDVLKRRGVPVIRFGEILWQGVDETVCPVAADYARRLFQFPCHQELGAEDVDWLIEEIRRAVLARDAQPVRNLS